MDDMTDTLCENSKFPPDDRPAGPCGLCRNFETNVTAVGFSEPGFCRHHKRHMTAFEGCPDAFASILAFRRIT